MRYVVEKKKSKQWSYIGIIGLFEALMAVVGVVIKDGDRYLQKFSKWKQKLLMVNVALGSPLVAITLGQTNVTPEEVVEEMKRYLALYRGTPSHS